MGDETILVRVSGTDGPGITAGLLHVLEGGDVEILDMEQVVIRDRLNLGVLVGTRSGDAPLKELLYFGWQRGLDVDFAVVPPPEGGPLPPRHAVTVLGETLSPGALGGVADAIVAAGGNIERIGRLSRYPVISYELLIVGGDFEDLRSRLLHASVEHRVDIAVQREGLARRAKRLVVIDVDSTLIRHEVVDLLAEEAGTGRRVREITAAALRGEIDFTQALIDRTALIAGLDEAALGRVANRVELTPGARTFVRTLRRLGFTVAIVSGGFRRFVETIQSELDIDYAYANELEMAAGRTTGRLVGGVIDGPGKASLLREVADKEGVPLEQTVAVGDGANDLEMLSIAGLGIAFNARPVVGAAADTSLNVPYLDAVLFMLGIRREEIEDADRLDPSLSDPLRPRR